MRELSKRRAKIVATLGPASSSPEVIRKMIKAGLDVARLNFSHGTHEDHSRIIEIVRREAQALGKSVAVFQDLCGPKVRIGPVEGGEITLQEGKTIQLQHVGNSNGALGNEQVLYIEAFDPVQVLQPGEKAFLADGRIVLIAAKVEGNAIECSIANGGQLRSKSGIAVPDSMLSLPCLTDKDKLDMQWGVKNKVDYIALSFVGSEDDLRAARQVLEEYGESSIPIIAKIERRSAMDRLRPIIEEADAVMVARGDLGLELPIAKVPGAQRQIIAMANSCGTPVITATQMLLSMVHEVRPTRAEVTDVSTAVRDGTDAVMLSEETTIGEHPAEAVRMLSDIVLEAEDELRGEECRVASKQSGPAEVAEAVCFAACNAGEKVGASAMIACTLSGFTARLMAKYRPRHPLFGVTPERESLARMALYWGVEPVLVRTQANSTIELEVTEAMRVIREQYGVVPGARVVVTAGLRSGVRGTTNVMEIREIPV